MGLNYAQAIKSKLVTKADIFILEKSADQRGFKKRTLVIYIMRVIHAYFLSVKPQDRNELAVDLSPQ